jgi:ribosomal-protein-alanine N-acetyltransferase
MTTLLSSPRCILTGLEPRDTGFILELLNSPGWLTYIGDRQIKTSAAALNYIEQGPNASFREHGFGLFLVKDKVSGASMGLCGLIKRPELPVPDLGFAFLTDFQGRGFATEAAAAVIDWTRNNFQFPTIAGITTTHNQASMRVLEKLGFTWEKTIPWKGEPDLNYFVLHL